MKFLHLKMSLWATIYVLLSPYVNSVDAEATVDSINLSNMVDDDFDLQIVPETSSKLLISEENKSDYNILDEIDDDLQKNNKRSPARLLIYRGCIRRNGYCDHRPHDCCYNSSCRCNLWGSNCRCQRMGLFQKWG